ncbi:hypothetical protein N5923_21950 [Erwiniaceae bacterium BAC15a-03b]|uniref:Uncharacterized protein n=1 Tax=Winslowiella arboricola TaxID=2978220 RepID=A0A9J6Q1M3_9GAMM|nr:hypothetical protein [Winslowiella arboricola]MCU5774689.1 hypothetical protein [Winslowiella arboricola]MCU5780159.1 hypothetical protein [Winslowiella arboricola]
MTKFIIHHINQFSIVHAATFFSNGVEYEITFQKLSSDNLIDSTLIFPDNFIFSNKGCWEVTFDIAENARKGTHYHPPVLGRVNAIQVFRIVENIIIDHYKQFQGGMYMYLPVNDEVAAIYRRLASKRLGKGITLEIGLEPYRRGNVLRTPQSYTGTSCRNAGSNRQTWSKDASYPRGAYLRENGSGNPRTSAGM